MRERLHIATVCSQHREILDRWGIGVELDQFCMAASMKGEARQAADREIAELKAVAGGMILHAPFN